VELINFLLQWLVAHEPVDLRCTQSLQQSPICTYWPLANHIQAEAHQQLERWKHSQSPHAHRWQFASRASNTDHVWQYRYFGIGKNQYRYTGIDTGISLNDWRKMIVTQWPLLPSACVPLGASRLVGRHCNCIQHPNRRPTRLFHVCMWLLGQ